MTSCVGANPSLSPIGAGSVFASWSNPCSCCQCLCELFSACFVLLRSVSQRATGVSLGPLSRSALLVHFVQSQSVLQSSSEVARDRRIWGQSGTCNLQGSINGLGVLG